MESQDLPGIGDTSRTPTHDSSSPRTSSTSSSPNSDEWHTPRSTDSPSQQIIPTPEPARRTPPSRRHSPAAAALSASAPRHSSTRNERSTSSSPQAQRRRIRDSRRWPEDTPNSLVQIQNQQFVVLDPMSEISGFFQFAFEIAYGFIAHIVQMFMGRRGTLRQTQRFVSVRQRAGLRRSCSVNDDMHRRPGTRLSRSRHLENHLTRNPRNLINYQRNDGEEIRLRSQTGQGERERSNLLRTSQPRTHSDQPPPNALSPSGARPPRCPAFNSQSPALSEPGMMPSRVAEMSSISPFSNNSEEHDHLGLENEPCVLPPMIPNAFHNANQAPHLDAKDGNEQEDSSSAMSLRSSPAQTLELDQDASNCDLETEVQRPPNDDHNYRPSTHVRRRKRKPRVSFEQ